MAHMRFLIQGLLTTAVLVQGATNANAQPTPEPATLLDSQVVAALRVRPGKLAYAQILDRLTALVPAQRTFFEWARPLADQQLAGLARSGASELFIAVDFANLPQTGFVVVPPTGVQADALATWLAGFGLPAPQKVGELLVSASPESLARLAKAPREIRPEVTEALAAAVDAPLALILIPSELHRRAIEQMYPELPGGIGGSGTLLTRGVRWAVVRMPTTKPLAVQLIIQSADEDAATALAAKCEELLRMAKEDQGLRAKAPDLGASLELLLPRREGNRLLVDISDADGSLAAVAQGLSLPVGMIQANARRAQSMNNLKQILLAMHNYHDAYKHFPPPATLAADGKPLLSWRVALLPFLDEGELYKAFRQDEAWDSPHNKRLIERMPDVFQSGLIAQPHGMTTYLAPTGEETAFPGKPLQFRDFHDGTSSTILLVEANPASAVEWTRPVDLEIDPQQPRRGLEPVDQEAIITGFTDGSVRLIPLTPSEQLWHYFTRSGGEVNP